MASSPSTSPATSAAAVSSMAGIAAHIATAATAAVATLEALLASRDEWVRLKAAATILYTTIEYNQEALITERVAALEERARALTR